MIAKHVPMAVALYPRTYPGLLVFAKKVRGSLTGNTWLPNPTPSLAIFGGDIDAFDAAQTKAGGKDPVAVADRDAKALRVYHDIGYVVGYTQGVANTQASYADAVTVILSAGLAVRKPATYQKPELRAKYTGFPGEVQLVARAVPGAGAYFWEQSLDQKTWMPALETTKSKATITALSPGQTVYFRFRALTSAGKTEPSQVVDLIVH